MTPKHGDYSNTPIWQAAQIMTDAAQILDVVKREWGSEGCWSDWDQGVRDRISEWLRLHYAGYFDNHRDAYDYRTILQQPASPRATDGGVKLEGEADVG